MIAALVEDLGTENVVVLLDLYLRDAPVHLQRILAAITPHDVGEVLAAAHALKSAGAMVGATGVAALAEDVELQGRSGDLTGLDRKTRDLVLVVAESCARIRTARRRISGFT